MSKSRIKEFFAQKVWGVPFSTGLTFMLLILCMILTGIFYGWYWGVGLAVASVLSVVWRQVRSKSRWAAAFSLLVFAVTVTSGAIAASRLAGLGWGLALAVITVVLAFFL